MRVALVTEFYYPHLGGVTEHVHNLARLLDQAGHQAIVITSHMEAVPKPRAGVERCRSCAGPSGRDQPDYLQRRLVRPGHDRHPPAPPGPGDPPPERIELVHVHGGLNPALGLVAPDAAGDLDIPVVATFHSWFRRSALCRIFRGQLQRRLDRHAAVIAVSQPVVAAHARYLEADWQIIPNGVDTRFFRPHRIARSATSRSSSSSAGWIQGMAWTPCSPPCPKCWTTS